MKKQSTTSYIVSGRVTNQQRQPIVGLTVQAFDQDPKGENQLGKSTVTDENGAYQIAYTDEDFRIGGKESGGADIIVRVFEKDVLLSETEPRRDAGVNETINITIDKVVDEPLPQTLLTPLQQARLGNLSETISDKKLRTELETAFTEAKGDAAAALSNLSGNKRFDKNILSQLAFTNQLAELTDDHAPLVNAFRLNDKTNSLRDIALEFNRSQFAELVGKTGVPEDFQTDDKVPSPNIFADKVYDKLFQLEPTAVIMRMTANAKETPITNKVLSGNVATFLSNQPETFNIKTTSIYEAFKHENAFKDISPELRNDLTIELKSLQRVAALSPIPEALPVLMKANMTSALRVSDMPEAQFIQAFSKEFGTDGEMIAQQVHTTAVNARIRNEQFLRAVQEAGQGTGVAFIDKSLNAQSLTDNKAVSADEMKSLNISFQQKADEQLQKHNLSWDLLFADADFCECGECTSVYSAAAYFVELLQYLRNNNLEDSPTNDPTIRRKTDPKDISNTPLEKLFNRRPDLGCLQLTCPNTNTILPYIDLVNEVMENYIVFHHPKPFNVEEDETSGELLAQPQHTEYEAYCILHKAVYPFTLPYHQPIDAARIFLDYLGTSRTELIDIFRSPRKEKIELIVESDAIADDIVNPTTDAESLELDKLHNEYLNRAVDAEFLSITQEEYIILTKEAFVSKEYWDKQCKKEHSLEEYRTKIGVKPVHQYYGFDTEAVMLSADESKKDGLTFVKNQFLRRTGVEYLDLVELLKTRCLNPNMPQGEALSIMNSLGFSYRFLQTKVDNKATNPKAKYEKLIAFLNENQPLVPFLEAILHPDPCNPQKPDNCAETKDFENWIHCYFEKIGKIIVLENGGKCHCVEGEFESLNIFDDKGNGFSRGRVTINKNCEITLKEINQAPVNIIIGQMDCSNGKLIGGIVENRQVDFKKNSEIFTTTDGRAGFIKDGILLDKETKLPLVAFEAGKDTCDLNTVRLIHLDGSPVTVDEYDHIHRFIRLWRKLGWTIDETDKALVGLSQVKDDCIDDLMPDAADCNDDCNDLFDEADDCGTPDTNGDCFESKAIKFSHCDITPDFLHQLVAVKKLLDKSGLELIKLLSFWTNISSSGEKSLYKRLFLTHNLIGLDKIFQADKNGNYLIKTAKITEHIPVLMAAFNVSADDIAAIVEDSKMKDELTLTNLSLIYRYRLLSKVLSLRIPAFISTLPLFGKPFKDADTTLEFIERWGKMEDAGFTYRQLNYIIKNHDDPKKPLSPTRKTILQLAKTLYDGLNAIDEAHKDLAANPATKDVEQQKIEIEAQASMEFVRSKAALLFDPSVVEQITNILEGTSAFITNAPKNLTSVQDKLNPEKDKSDVPVPPILSTLRKKIKYDAKKGAVQVTGILTPTETTELKSWSSDPQWNGNKAAIYRIENQQKNLFKAVLFDIFKAENEKAENKIDVERQKSLTKAEETIKVGDISIAFDQIPQGQTDPNTAAPKRVAFFTVFLPYLRRQLTHRFIVDTLSGLVGLDRKVTDVFISEVLRVGTPSAPVYNIFEAIKESAKPTSIDWNGYMIPSAEGQYTFIVKDSDAKPDISIDGNALEFTAQEDPTNEWWSNAQKLQAGKLYKFAVNGIDLKNLYWKTPTSSIAAIPSSILLPDFAAANCEPAFVMLKKAALLASGFNLSADEIQYLDAQKTDFGGVDFNNLTLEHWLRLEAYTRLRNSLPPSQTNILEFFKWTHQPDDVAKLSEKVAELTIWKKDRIDKLMVENHFNLNRPAAFRNEENLLKLQKALGVADKIGMDIDLLFDWAKPTSNFKKCREIADSIQKAIRALYKQTDWEQIVKPLNDKLRENQKNALIAYLLQQPDLIKWGVTDADGLFEYFLIDVQMAACMETSRIKQAISSVQLFVQRCFLGLEEEHNGIKPNVLDRGRWDWMQRYRVWEANRKVFLYPENWIESNLRDDKSPFFKELESELLQKDINKQNITDALKSYLYKVDEVANMEVVGLFIDGTRTDKNSKLHVFSRTRNAPYSFYYRYLALDEMNWYAWEKMQVDIPSYDVEDISSHVITGNGCYLTPVVWNGRLLIFFPQIIKKARPNGSNPPVEYLEVKMAWSEYQNKKWTQKQISVDAWSIDIQAGIGIDKLAFIPVISDSNVVIHIEDQRNDTDTLSVNGFTFSGSFFNNDKDIGAVRNNLPTSIAAEYGGSTVFQKVFNKIQSMQVRNNIWGNDDAVFRVENDKVSFNYSKSSINALKFHHSFTHYLMGEISLGRLEAFFKFNTEVLVHDADKKDAFGAFDHDNNSATPDTYHELKRPYSLYNWELFFHTPMMLADALSKAQQFEEAMKWYHYVFNPMAEGADDKRFWQFSPFKEADARHILDSIFNGLKPNTKNDAINDWRNHPFMPHSVARSRPVAYMKWVVMKYVDNLVAWGDYLFRQDTIESLNQATQLYVLAGHILGKRPQMIPKRGKIKPQTYNSLLDKWDAFSNAMVELELAAPFSNQINQPVGNSNGVVGLANVFGFATSLYFCIPNNPKLIGYWDTIADRLFKIRHCLNFEGVFRKLPLFEPPIDPSLLVKAAAQGLSIDSVLNDLNTPMPNYRFYYLLQKALELCGELKSLGAAMLSAIEKKDNEAVALMRAKHESTMHNLVMEIKKHQLEEAQKSLETLQQNRQAPEERMKYYLKLSGLDESAVPSENAAFNGLPNEIVTVDGDSGLKLIPFEKEDMDKASEAQEKQLDAALPEKLASISHIIPNFNIPSVPSFSFGGSNLGAAGQAWAKFIQLDASELSYASSSASKKGGFTRAKQDRVMQANAAGFEIKQIDKQITAQQIRINIANQEITNQQKQIDNADEMEEFLKNKYTNEELYAWIKGNLRTVYHQVYSLAFELSKKAEKVFRFERGLSNSNFIQAGYWDDSHNGLLSGEQLYVGLKQLEAAYQENRGYDYEVTKHISLRQINPIAVLQLKETGKCEFELPEILFDMDYPGHFKRRVKSVSLSIPCIAGPYTNINGTLRLLENKFRNTAIGGKNYLENTEETDDRFSTFIIPISAIAASSAQNDGGMFELNFKDERYLPFEGAGVTSKWRLELPAFRQFDYDTISDVVVHLRYTSSEGGERLKKASSDSVLNFIKSNEELRQQEGLFAIIDLKHDLPSEWHQAMQVKAGDTERTLSINNLKDFLPFYVKLDKNGKLRDAKNIDITDTLLVTSVDLKETDFSISVEDNDFAFNGAVSIGGAKTFVINEEMKIENWKLHIKNTDKVIDKALLIVRFILK